MPQVAIDVWQRRGAKAAARSVFVLASENPILRPSSGGVAERWAAELADAARPVPRRAAEEVVAALSEADVSRLVGLTEQLAAGRWRELVDLVGIEAAREPLLAGVATAAISDLLPPPRWLVAMREATTEEAPGPLNVLASLLHPESVWSSEQIGGAHALAAPLPLGMGATVVFSFADAELEGWQLERARVVARPAVPTVPLPEAPLTSRQLADALELIRRDEPARELCRLLLLAAVLTREGLVPAAPSPN